MQLNTTEICEFHSDARTDISDISHLIQKHSTSFSRHRNPKNRSSKKSITPIRHHRAKSIVEALYEFEGCSFPSHSITILSLARRGFYRYMCRWGGCASFHLCICHALLLIIIHGRSMRGGEETGPVFVRIKHQRRLNMIPPSTCSSSLRSLVDS